MKAASSRGIDNKFLELLSLRRKKDDLKSTERALWRWNGPGKNKAHKFMKYNTTVIQ
jgi:hypothetical protein